MRATPVDLWWQNITRTDACGFGCWLWTGYCTLAGYGAIRIRRQPFWYAHRLAWTIYFGPIPDGLEIHHRCKNKRCVNPAHLELLTHAENCSRERVSFCKNGHRLAGDNLMAGKLRRGERVCRRCDNARRKRRWHARTDVKHRT